MKKGLSDIVNVLMLISMTLLMIGGVFLAAQYFISKAQSQAMTDKLCSEVSFNSGDFCHETQEVQNLETGTSEMKTRINFNVQNNATVPIESFILLIEDNNGNSIPISSLINSNVDVNGAKQVTSDFIDNSENINQIKVYPTIIFKNETILCKNNEKVLSWGDIPLC